MEDRFLTHSNSSHQDFYPTPTPSQFLQQQQQQRKQHLQQQQQKQQKQIEEEDEQFYQSMMEFLEETLEVQSEPQMQTQAQMQTQTQEEEDFFATVETICDAKDSSKTFHWSSMDDRMVSDEEERCCHSDHPTYQQQQQQVMEEENELQFYRNMYEPIPIHTNHNNHGSNSSSISSYNTCNSRNSQSSICDSMAYTNTTSIASNTVSKTTSSHGAGANTYTNCCSDFVSVGMRSYGRCVSNNSDVHANDRISTTSSFYSTNYGTVTCDSDKGDDRSLLSSRSRKSKTRSSCINSLSFPAKLMEILNEPAYSSMITWTANGEAFMVLNPRQLESSVLSKYFSKNSGSESPTSMDKFWKSLRVWGFTFVEYFPMRKSGFYMTNHIGHFQHKLFRRDHQELMKGMRRNGPSHSSEDTCRPLKYKRQVSVPHNVSTNYKPQEVTSHSRIISPSSSIASSPSHSTNEATIRSSDFTSLMQQNSNSNILWPAHYGYNQHLRSPSYNYTNSSPTHDVPNVEPKQTAPQIPLEDGRTRSNAILKGMMMPVKRNMWSMNKNV